MAIFKKKNGQLVDFSNPIPDTSIAPIENGATSTHNYVVGAYALVKGILKKVTNAISIGTAFSDSNSETTDVATELKELNDDVTTINTQLSQKQNIIKSVTDTYTFTGGVRTITMPNDCNDVISAVSHTLGYGVEVSYDSVYKNLRMLCVDNTSYNGNITVTVWYV